MKMRKIISLLTTAMLVFTLMPAGVVLADSFTVVSTSPGDGATNVSVLDDLTITFSSAVDSSTLTSDNIIITGGNAYFTVDMQSDTVATVMFDTALDYGTTYEVLLTSNITDTNQNPLTETEFSFKTQENPITLLFEEDFEGDAQEALEKFEQIWTTMEEGESFEVANNALSITALGDVKAGDNWEGRPVLQIKGSENWEDYEVEFDFFRNGERAYPNILFRFSDTSNYYIVYNYHEYDHQTADKITLRKRVNATTSTVSEVIDKYFSRYERYKAKISAIGANINYEVETDQGIINSSMVDSDNASGAVAFSNYRYTVYFDNIVAHDKGFLFTPSAIKNISDVITLEFNEDIDYSTVVGNVSVSDSNGPVDFNLSQNGTNAVDIQLTDAQLDTVYTITANESISNADGTKSLLNEKSFDVKTAKQENTFAIQSTYPENGSTNVSVVDDVTFEFTNPVDITTLTDENIIVSGDTNYSILLEDENIISIIFDDALDYSTTYNIEFTPGVKDIYNNPLLVGTLTFKTASGINVLFEEDFEGDPEEALARFVDMGRTHDPEYYIVENGALKIVAQTEDGYEQRPKLMIKGSEIWSDYTVKVDAQAASPRAFIGIMARFHDRDNYYETLLYFETAGSNNDRVILRKRKPEYGYAVLDEAEPSDYFARYTYYPCELTVKGNEISYYVETKGEPLTGTKTDYAHANGGVAFANTRYTVLYDNIVILDEGFLFTPSRIKNVKDRITLQFNEDVNFSTVDGNITVSDAYGTVDAIISQQGTNGVEIKLVDPQPNTVYTVDVSKNVQSSDGKGMTTDKTFDIKTEIPVVENLSIKTGDQTVNSLTGNMAIYASGDIRYFGLQGEQEYTLILAVYDNNGHLYDLSYASETLYAGDTQYTPLTTPTITLPPNVNGYSVKAFVWDDMVNIKPISSSVEVK